MLCVRTKIQALDAFMIMIRVNDECDLLLQYELTHAHQKKKDFIGEKMYSRKRTTVIIYPSEQRQQ